MGVKERIKEYAKYKKIPISTFESKSGLSNGYVKNITSGIGGIKLENILNSFGDLDRVWLLTGEGEMLRTEKKVENNLDSIATSNNYKLIPLYNLDAVGGVSNDVVGANEYISTYIPFIDAQSLDICLPITGNSMSPTYPSGCIVRVREVESWQEFLETGQVYVVCLSDGRRLIKELRRSDEAPKDNYLCVSHNTNFEPVELPKKLISKVFLVCAMYQKTTM